MRRAALALAAVAFTALGLAGQASAASGQVTHIRFSGAYAEASWRTTGATSETDTYILVIRSKQGPHLEVARTTNNFDANGLFTGATETISDVTSGYSLAIDLPQLGSATLSGAGLPAQTCTLDANHNVTGCTDATIDVTAAWSGAGPVTHLVSNNFFRSAGMVVTDHFNGTSRDATATGTFAGRALAAGDLTAADLGVTKSGTTTSCIGTAC